jgi:hypothetical protein
VDKTYSWCKFTVAMTWKGNSEMFRPLAAPSPREVMKWCAYAVLLLTPGSFVVLPVLWLVRRRQVSATLIPIPIPPSRQ